MIFVDANILIDLIEENQRWADWSEAQLRAARQSGALVINVVVYAGSAQLAVLSLLVAHAPLWVVWLTAAMVNVRIVFLP